VLAPRQRRACSPTCKTDCAAHGSAPRSTGCPRSAEPSQNDVTERGLGRYAAAGQLGVGNEGGLANVENPRAGGGFLSRAMLGDGCLFGDHQSNVAAVGVDDDDVIAGHDESIAA